MASCDHEIKPRTLQARSAVKSIWTFVKKSENREILSWIGGGVVIVAGALWAVVTFLWPDHSATTVCAKQGSIAAGRDASRNRITTKTVGSSAPAGSEGSVACVEGAKK
jgi:hypothetical protein